MKVLLSHDVDHVTVWEHLTKDAIIPKFIIRAHLELVNGKIGIAEFLHRFGDFFHNKWNGIDEIITFHNSKGIKSTFFVGVNNGVGLSYPLSLSKQSIQKIIEAGFEAGVHGIDFDTAEKVKKEYDTFKSISGQDKFGIRMHYLRQNEHTFRFIKEAGYIYDATSKGNKDPFTDANGLWEFPLQIMDGWMIDGDKRWQSRNLEQAKQETLIIIQQAFDSKLEYMSLLFHDRYFTNSFVTWKEWYIWVVEYLISQKCEFMTHMQAVNQLENKAR